MRAANPKLGNFEASCFDGKYITGDITADYLSQLAFERDELRGQAEADLLEVESPRGRQVFGTSCSRRISVRHEMFLTTGRG